MSAITDALAKSRAKDEIVFYILLFNKTGDAQHLKQASNKIETFAKGFNVNVNQRQTQHGDCINDALIDFVINEKGYNKTIPLLYHQVCNNI